MLSKSEDNKSRVIPNRIIAVILLSIVLIIGVYSNYLNKPCSRPIQYKVGDVDARFGISQAELNKTVEQAIDVWEKPLEKDLFEYNPDAELKVDLVFDYRQEEANRQKKLEAEIIQESDSIDALERTHKELVSTLTLRSSAYKDEVSHWEAVGGAPSADFYRLEQERVSLNHLIDRVNGLATKINSLAGNTNLKVIEYNAAVGKTYTHGQYEQSKAQISVFQLDTLDDLRLVLAHELGHALNIDHATDPKSLMYSILQQQNFHELQLTAEDLALIKTECNLY